MRQSIVWSVVVLLALVVATGCENRGKAKKLKVSAKVVKSDDPGTIVIEYQANTPCVVEVEGLKKSFVRRKKKDQLHIDENGLKLGKSTLTLQVSSQFGKASVKVDVERKAAPTVEIKYKKKAGDGEVQLLVTSYHLKLGGRIAVPMATGKAKMSLKTSPGTKISFLGKTWTSAAGKDSLSVELNVLGAAWDRKPSQVYKEVKYPIKITTAEGRSLSSEIKFSAGSDIMRAFGEVRAKALLAPGEKPEGPRKGLVALEKRGKHWRRAAWIGTTKKLRDVTLVAFIENGKRRTKHCGSYRGRKTGKTQKISNDAQNMIVTVVDRRTGKTVKKKRFKAKMPRCPKSTKYGGSTGRVGKKKMLTWLVKLMKRMK